MERTPNIWVLLGSHQGDNNQLIALADSLGLQFRPVHLGYNFLHHLPPRWLGSSFISLDWGSRRALQRPSPDLVLGIGRRSVPASLAIRRASRGRTRIVRLGNPRVDPRRFDLVITTPQYSVPDAANLLRLPLAITREPAVAPDEEEQRWLDALPRPHRLLVVGGPTFMWKLAPATVEAAARQLAERARGEGGSLIAIGSPRTPRPVLDRLQNLFADGFGILVTGDSPRYRVLLADADELHVTGDSVSMLSEAIGSQKKVGLVEPTRTLIGRLLYRWAALRRRPVPVRDLTRFWQTLRARHLVGTPAVPVAAETPPDPAGEAANAVLELLD